MQKKSLRNKVLLQLNKFFVIAVLLLVSFGAAAQNNEKVSWTKMSDNRNASFYDVQKDFYKQWDEKIIQMARNKALGIKKKAPGYKAFKRWEAKMAPRVYPSGDMSLLSATYPNFLSWKNNAAAQRSTPTSSLTTANWTELGPVGTPSGPSPYSRTGAGRVNFVRFDPNNSNTMYIGTPDGGLWKSTNGGTAWTTNTDFLSIIGCADLAIDPTNTNIMYLATGDVESDRRSIGVFKSLDGGATWNPTALTFATTDNYRMTKMSMDPTNSSVMIAITDGGIFRTDDGWATSSQTQSGNFKDLEFNPGNHNTVYAAGSTFWKSTDNGVSWSQVTTGLPSSDVERIALGVSPGNAAYVYALIGKSSDQGYLGLYRSINNGTSFSLRSSSPNLLGYEVDGSDAGGQAFYDLAIAVSPTNAEIVTTGGVNHWQSTNGGTTWANKSYWASGEVHADIHELSYLPGSSTVMFSCNDGGIFKSTNDGDVWTDITNNLAIAQVVGLGLSQTTSTSLVAGMQDNGTNLKTGSSWSNIFGGDGGDCFIDPTNSNTIFIQYVQGDFHRSTNGGLSTTTITTGLPGGFDFYSNWKQDPVDANKLYTGGVSRLYGSGNKGTSWSALGTPPGSGSIKNLAIAPSNNTILYAVKDNAVSKSTNSGAAFTNITGTLPVGSAALTSVTVSNTDANKVWVTFSGYSSANKVFRSVNGGTTWTNISTGLPNLPMNTLVYTNGSANDAIYVGGDIGVYYFDNTLSSWVPFFTGLPNTNVRELEIFNSGSKLRAATYGRGVWETDLYSAAVNYTITASAGANGTITPNEAVSVASGDNQTFTIAANACYQVADVLVDGVSVGAVTTYTFSNVTANHTISATFSQLSYTITATTDANGSISPIGAIVVNCGANQTFTIATNTCYQVADVLMDGVSVGAVTTYTFSNVTANHTISASFSQLSYTITSSAGANGTISPNGATVVNCGANQTFAISANSCYQIADVLVDGVSQGAISTYTFNNVMTTHTISATFALISYTVTSSAGANGTISPNGATAVNCDANQTFTITANTCYQVADVLVDGVSVGAVTTYTFSNVTANHTISASFSQLSYTITSSAGANGTISPNGATVVACGANQTYTITPDALYSVADVLVDGVSVGAVTTYTFSNVTATHTISATFVQGQYTITATAGANGSISPSGAVSVASGANQTFTIAANTCYQVADVLVDGVSVGAVTTYTFTNVTANHTISASFSQLSYTITSSAGANGSISPNGATVVTCGNNQTYTIAAAGGFAVLDVIVDGVSVGAVTTYTFSNVSAAHTISATFVEVVVTYTITASAGANGSISPSGAVTVASGADQTFTIAANTCYQVADVLVDGVSVGAVTTYTFTNVTANHTISASFSQLSYTITSSAGANGTISPNGATIVACGANQTYTITPDALYSVADVLVDGVSVGAVTTYTFSNVTATHTISATFVQGQYTITATAGANGSISPSGAVSVASGANQTFTIAANACYQVADVLVDGVSVGAVTTYTFTNVTANHTISASFSQLSYTITSNAGANGTISPNGATIVACGANQTYTITPDALYSVADVLVDGVSVGAVTTYTFSNVTATHTISATFVQGQYTITATAGANGSISPSGAVSVASGANQTFTIAANACYQVADVLVDGVSVGAVTTYTFTNVTANHTISASFSQLSYTITSNAGANGTISPNGATVVTCGNNQTYTIAAAGGFAVLDVIVDGVSVGAVTTYTFSNVSAAHTINATFVEVVGTYTITASAGGNGSISPSGAVTVASGADQTFTIAANVCNAVANVLVDGVSVGAVSTYTFSNVSSNHSISVTFALSGPLMAPVVTGPVNVCPYVGTGIPITYTFNSAGATGYSYTLPPTNVTLVSSTANSITITFGAGFLTQANKQIRVRALSACGNSPLKVYYLVAQIPSTPQPIMGTTSVCAVIGTANTLTYTISSVPGAASYIWTAQAGTTTITHPNGTGVNDTTVNVSFSAGFTNSSITVASANDGCGLSGIRSFALTNIVASTPGLIAGPTNACENIAPGGTAATYSVEPIAGQTYNWTVPVGAINLTGQGSATISFIYPAGFTGGVISVTATNGCGSSASPRTLNVSKLNPATPSVIDVIETQGCPDRIFTYSISGMPANSVSVQWTVPASATGFTGQGTASITVTYPSTSIVGSVSATAVNNCGISTVRSVSVKLPACVVDEPTFAGQGSIVKGKSLFSNTAETINVIVYPNPIVNEFKLQVLTAGKESIRLRILDLQGRVFKSASLIPYQTITLGSDLKSGSYLAEIRQGSKLKVIKLIKF